MLPRPAHAPRGGLRLAQRQCLRANGFRRFGTQSQRASTKARPTVPFLLVPTSNTTVVRYFTSARNGWFRHEAKLVARYTITFWGVGVALVVIVLAINEEVLERQYPTPHEWNFMTRKYLRDAQNHINPRNGEINWARALELSRGVVIRLEDPKLNGESVRKLSHKVDMNLEVPGEFIACDIIAKSEEWKRGYFEALALAAKSAEHVDGWVRDITRNVVSPPQYVIGPSNPNPTPVAAEDPRAPREEDCQPAYPDADNWYRKIMATVGFTARQRLEAALDYASFLEFKGRRDEASIIYNLALKESTQEVGDKELPFDPQALTIRDGGPIPSLNVLDALTSIANFKARKGDISSALPIYLSLLKARRSLSNERPQIASLKPANVSIHTKIIEFFSPPAYPPPPPDGTLPPWRSPEERCQEASLHLYIGEILYATKSRDDGISWTRDGVDQAEDQLRGLSIADKTPSTQQTCRDCLETGLHNWKLMVSTLAKLERNKAETHNRNQGGMFTFWGGSQESKDRWSAEEEVVTQRLHRTRELLEDVRPPSRGILSWVSA